MTKERRLAIKMWEEIKSLIKKDFNFYVADYKNTFCVNHNLDWMSDCWFCQYMIADCNLCPLYKPIDKYFRVDVCDDNKGCVDYWIATNGLNNALVEFLDDNQQSFKKEERLKACDRIIDALKGVGRMTEEQIELGKYIEIGHADTKVIANCKKRMRTVTGDYDNMQFYLTDLNDVYYQSGDIELGFSDRE